MESGHSITPLVPTPEAVGYFSPLTVGGAAQLFINFLTLVPDKPVHLCLKKKRI